ncbi:MAG: enoyl-CoA hydratase/isomerase family protein [Gemmatimonadota bacterium]
MIRRENRDAADLVWLEHGKANAIDVEMASELVRELEEARAEDGVRALVLTAAGPIFSAGVDLFRLLEGGSRYVQEFLPVLRSLLVHLYTFPKPVIAALNGHAIAGGCVVACACDLRLMSEGSGRIGVPELRVGVPFPPLALEIVRGAVPRRFLRELVYRGETYSGPEALRRGLIDELVDADRLVERALEAARELASVPPAAFALTKRQMHGPVLERAAGGAGETAADGESVWMDPATHRAIRAYVEATLGRS